MMYVITEKRDNDRFVIYDMKNKGSACVSKYTIKQLIEDNSTIIIGVTYSFKEVGSNEVMIENIIPHSKDGKAPVTRQIKNAFVPDTKRSYATVIKGLYPSRTEKKALNEKAKKTKATKKANAKAKKVAEETAKKEHKEQLKQYKAEVERMRVVTKRIQKSKPQFFLQNIDIIASEYNEKIDYKFKVQVRTPAALTKLNNLIKSTSCFCDTRGAGDKVRRGLWFETTIRTDSMIIFDDPDIQVFADKEVWLDFDGNWGNRCEIRFSVYENYKPQFTYTHGTTFDEGTHFGADACCDHSANGEARWLRKSLGRPA